MEIEARNVLGHEKSVYDMGIREANEVTRMRSQMKPTCCLLMAVCSRKGDLLTRSLDVRASKISIYIYMTIYIYTLTIFDSASV